MKLCAWVVTGSRVLERYAVERVVAPLAPRERVDPARRVTSGPAMLDLAALLAQCRGMTGPRWERRTRSLLRGCAAVIPAVPCAAAQGPMVSFTGTFGWVVRRRPPGRNSA
jgi:hypothetical protein